MKYLLIFLFIPAAIFTACREEHGHPHEEEAAVVSHTIITNEVELFVEFPPLVVGKTSPFTAHFTIMENYKPVAKGSLTVSLIRNKRGIRHKVNAPASPGIFRPALQPKEAGVYQLVFDLHAGEVSEKIIIDSVRVYKTIEEAIATHLAGAEGDEIAFLKEQAWKIDFNVQQVEQKAISEVIHTSGQITSLQGDEAVIAAKTSGIVLFNPNQTFIGNKVSAGQTLFQISGKGVAEGGIEHKIATARAAYLKAKADYERAQELVKDNIISQKTFEDRKATYEVAKLNYETLSRNVSSGGQRITAPFTGYLKELLVNEGAYVQSGTPLATITQNKRLMMRADVPQQYMLYLSSIQSANFKTPAMETPYTLEAFNGKVLSFGKSVGQKTGQIPVYFEIDNKERLLPGSFVEIWLKTTPIEDALVIPLEAVMKDYETQYVYVQTGGESFEKREIKTGVSNGIEVQVTEGLKAGEWIVTEGAYQVKMASMSSNIPAHGHSH